MAIELQKRELDHLTQKLNERHNILGGKVVKVEESGYDKKNLYAVIYKGSHLPQYDGRYLIDKTELSNWLNELNITVEMVLDLQGGDTNGNN